MSEVTLSKSVRANLLNLQNTAAAMGKTQQRLATGLKVNSALDNPTNFFTAQSLGARASDLSQLLDSVSNAIQTVEAADNGIKAITKLVQTAQSTARQALQDKSETSQTTEIGATGVDGATTRDEALDKLFIGDMGFVTGDIFQFTASDSDTGVSQTFTMNPEVGMTVRDFVAEVNSSGFVTADVDAAGKLSFSTDGNKSLSIRMEAVDGGNFGTIANTLWSNLGFGAADSDSQIPGFDVAVYNQAAGGTGASDVRADLAAQFDDLLAQINELAEDSGFNGVNLLGGSTESLTVAFNEDGSSSITIQGQDFSAEGLGLVNTVGDFATDDEINAKLDSLSDALSTLRTQASKFGSNLSVIETRQEFTKSMINTLETGAANLTLADTNEEAANMLALQTRQQLSSTALSLASQADQNVLRLF